MIFTRVCRRGKTFFSDLDKCPDNSREIPVTPVLHPKYQPYGSIGNAEMGIKKMKWG
jgi:hypothetical protein